jgi:hypothetical protein
VSANSTADAGAGVGGAVCGTPSPAAAPSALGAPSAGSSYTMSVFFNDVVRQVTMSYTM